jgi:hypothetical protein
MILLVVGVLVLLAPLVGMVASPLTWWRYRRWLIRMIVVALILLTLYALGSHYSGP